MKSKPLFSQNYGALLKPNYLPIPHPWLGEEGEEWAQFSVHSGTSPLGQLHSRDTKFGPGKCSHSLCILLYSIEGTPLFRGKGHFFWVLKLGFNLHPGDTLSLKKWLSPQKLGETMSQWWELSNHELSHLNRCTALVRIQHTTLQRWVNHDFLYII